MLLRLLPLRLFLLLIALSTLISCATDNNQTLEERKTYSKTQQRLLQLVDVYMSEYAVAKLDAEQEEVQSKYVNIIQSYLRDSLGGSIDTMSVTVDSVIQEGWKVTTQFHTGDIEFKYGMTFKDSMDARNDSLYQFMRNLKPGEEVTVNFVHMGAGEVNNPEDKRTKVFRIFAFPVPVNY